MIFIHDLRHYKTFISYRQSSSVKMRGVVQLPHPIGICKQLSGNLALFRSTGCCMQEEADRIGLSVFTGSIKNPIIHGVTCYHGALNRT